MQKQEYVQEIVQKSYQRARNDPAFLDKLVHDQQAALGEVLDGIPTSGDEAAPEGAARDEVLQQAGDLLQTAPFLTRKQVTALVLQLVEDSRQAYRNTMRQSQALFWVGVFLALLTVGVELIGMFSGRSWGELLAGGLFGSGLGLGFVYTAFIKRPLDQMQNSVGNLAQIQIIFLGYLDQLTVLMNHAGVASLEDATRVSQALNDAAEAASARIQTYCERWPKKTDGAPDSDPS